MKGFYDNLYEIGQEVPLKLLVHPDHIEMHSAVVSVTIGKDYDTLGTKKHVRLFFYPDMIAMNETIKRIQHGDFE